MKRAFAILAVMCFGAASASAQNPNDYRYSIPLVTQNAEGLHRVEIPLAVYQGAARADLGDLRVFNGRGEKVPFAFAGEAKREIEKPVPLALPYFPLYRVYSEGQPSVAPPAVNIIPMLQA